jgi:glutamate synthase (NADPH/NADH) large chain
MVELEPLEDDDREWLRATVQRHRELTGSDVADRLLAQWETEIDSFRKVMPQDYKRVLAVMSDAAASGLSEDETLAKVMEAAHG